MASDSSKKVHQPGEQVPTTGIYKVLHHAHRAPHEVVMRQAEVFPSCQQCGSDVRFELVHPVGEPPAQGSGGLQ